MRQDDAYVSLRNFRGGINQEPENALVGQVLDARNMWAPQGLLEQRLGYIGVWSATYDTPVADATAVLISEVAATGTLTAAPVGAGSSLTLSNLVALGSTHTTGDRWYLGSASTTAIGFLVFVTNFNSNGVNYVAEYWNGTTWTDFIVQETLSDNFSRISPHLGQAGVYHYLRFVRPADWATTTVTGSGTAYTKYFIRFSLVEMGSTALDANVTLDNGLATTLFAVTRTYGQFVGAVVANFDRFKRYILMTNIDADTTVYYFPYDLNDRSTILETGSAPRPVIYTSAAGTNFPASITVIPRWYEVWIAHDHYFRMINVLTENTVLEAQIEDRPEIVGTVGANVSSWSPTRIAQLQNPPQPRFVLWFDEKLWVANLDVGSSIVRWSARGGTLPDGTPVPTQRVWPSDSVAVLVDNDNSPITGLTSLDEHVIIFKQDTIWRMVFRALDSVNTELYEAVKVFSGIGCVAHLSIAQTKYGLVFLGQDGVYLFDGTTARKISGAIDPLIQTINPARIAWAAGTYWKNLNCYLLTIATDGSLENNTTLVFDLKHLVASEDGTGSIPAIWIWDNIQAQVWMKDVGQYDQETNYFGDNSGNIYQFNVNNLDNGAAIESYIQSHRLAYGDSVTKTARSLYVEATNQSSTVELTVQSDDEYDVSSGEIDFSNPDDTSLSEMLLDSEPLGAIRRNEQRLDFRETGRSFKVTLSHSVKGEGLQLPGIKLGIVPLGRR